MWKTLHKNKQDNHNKLTHTHTQAHIVVRCVSSARIIRLNRLLHRRFDWNERDTTKKGYQSDFAFDARFTAVPSSFIYFTFSLPFAVAFFFFRALIFQPKLEFTCTTRSWNCTENCVVWFKQPHLNTHTLTQQTITLAQQIFCTAEISKRWKKENSAHTRFFTNHFHFNESCSHTTIYSRCPPFSISLFLAPRYTEAHLVIMLLHLDYVYVNSRRINEPFNGHITFGECLFTVWHYWTKGRKINRNYSFDSNVIYRKRTENGNEMKFIQENHSKLGAKK